MQQATHSRLHLRDAHDAHVIFEAVRQGFLSPIVRRLNEMERGTLVRSGAVFVWFETEDDTGLKRWTGGSFLSLTPPSARHTNSWTRRSCLGTKPYARGQYLLYATLFLSDRFYVQPYLFYDERMPYDAAHATSESNR